MWRELRAVADHSTLTLEIQISGIASPKPITTHVSTEIAIKLSRGISFGFQSYVSPSDIPESLTVLLKHIIQITHKALPQVPNRLPSDSFQTKTAPVKAHKSPLVSLQLR
jgi:hypothetical protein